MLAMMADNIEHVISYWLLFRKFHSPVLAGFADISHWMPFLLLSVYFGGIADRYDCRKVIQLAQIMYMAVSVAWAVLFYRKPFRYGMRRFCSFFTALPEFCGLPPNNSSSMTSSVRSISRAPCVSTPLAGSSAYFSVSGGRRLDAVAGPPVALLANALVTYR